MSEFKSIIEARLLEYDSGIDLSEGSPAQTQIVAPLLLRLESDPFATDTRTFLKVKLKELFPSMSVIEGDAVVDILISAAQLYFEVYRREVQRVKDSQSINNIDLISDEDADALAANWLVNRNPGSFAVGIARILFGNPTSVTIGNGTVFTTVSGDKFLPAQTTYVSAAQMLLNVLPGPQYYVDVVVRSALPGSKYNIEAGKLVFATGLSNVIGVTNLVRFTGGTDREDNRTLLRDKLPQAITERSLTTARGVNARIRDLFNSIEASQVIGFKDPEMNRDLVWATAQGDTVGFGAVLLTGRAALISLFTSNRKVIAGDQLTVTYPESLYPGLLNREETFDIIEVSKRDRINLVPRIKERLLVVLDRASIVDKIQVLDPQGNPYPEGFIPAFGHAHGPPTVRVNINQQEDVLESGGIHVGGHTDVFIKPKTDSERAVTLVPSPDPQIAGHGLIAVDNTVVLSGNMDDLSSIKEKDYLIIETGLNAGSYRVFGTLLNPGGTVTLYLNENLQAEGIVQNSRWIATDNLSIDAFNPVKRLLPFGRVPLQVSTIIDQTEVATSVNVADYGVQVKDILTIESGGSSGSYIITEIRPASVIIHRVAPESSVGDLARIERTLRGISKPLTKITSVEFTEDRTSIPYGAPIGMETIYLGGAKTERDGVIGYVLPSISGLLPRDPNTGEFIDFYVSTVNIAEHIEGLECPYSTGALPRPAGSHLYSIETEVMQNGAPRWGYLQEFYLPKEVYETPYKNNVFVAVGNTQYQDLEGWINKHFGYVDDQGAPIAPADPLNFLWRFINYPLPRMNIEDPVPSKAGDVLSIHSGPNKGDYIIKDVHQIRLNLGPHGTWHRRLPISIVVIEGQFPEAQLDPLFGRISGLSPFKPNRHSYGLGDILRLLLSPIQLTSTADFRSAIADTTAAFQNRMGINIPLLNNGVITPTQIKEIVESYLYVPYSCGLPAKGVARVYFQEPVSTEIHTYSSGIEVSPSGIDIDFDQPPVFYGANSDNLRVIPEVGELRQHLVTPENFVDSNPLTWARDLVVAPLLNDAAQGKAFLARHPFDFGIEPSGRDRIRVLPEKVIIPSVKPGVLNGAPTPYIESPIKGIACATYTAGTNKLKILSPSPQLESDWKLELADVGSYLFIDEGPDAGGYIVTGVEEATRTIQIDKLLTSTTSKIYKRGTGRLDPANTNLMYFYLDNVNQDDQDRSLSSSIFADEDVGRYLTLWNFTFIHPVTGALTRTHLGSYLITAIEHVQGPTEYQKITIDCGLSWFGLTGQLVVFPGSRVPTFWMVTDAPRHAPPQLDNGRTELVGCVPVQIYEKEPEEYLVADINYVDISDFGVTFKTLNNLNPGATGIFDRIDRNMPYTITREGFYRISATEMALNTDGGLFYFDIPVQTMSHTPQANLPANTMLVTHNFECEGYKIVPKYKDLTYSVREESNLLFPISIIPEGEVDSAIERVSLLNRSLTINYDYSPEVSQFQSLLDQPVDRIVCASMLARRMLPATIGVSLRYAGGSVEKIIVEDIRKWIASLSLGYKPLEISDFISLAYDRGAKHVVTPIQLFAVIHDLNREVHLIKVVDALRVQDLVNYEGTPRITGLMPGAINPSNRRISITATRVANTSTLGSGG